MKATLLLAIAGAAAISSCANMDPEYQAWKRQQVQPGSANNPYGAPPADPNNPYATPGVVGEVGQYTPGGGNTPLQPLPPLPGGPNLPADPVPGGGAQIPVGATVDYTVVSGDTLWGIANKHGSSVTKIQQANGITGSNIHPGQVLKIPTQ